MCTIKIALSGYVLVILKETFNVFFRWGLAMDMVLDETCVPNVTQFFPAGCPYNIYGPIPTESLPTLFFWLTRGYGISLKNREKNKKEVESVLF